MYSYALNQPTKYVDPDGRFAIPLVYVVPPLIIGAWWWGTQPKPPAPITRDDCPPSGDFCGRRKDYCITFCLYELDMPGRSDNTGPYRACIRRCMNAAGCDY